MTIILDNGIRFSITKIEHFKLGEKTNEGFPEEHIRVWFQPCSVTGIADRGWYHVGSYSSPSLWSLLLDDKISIIEKEKAMLPNISSCVSRSADYAFFKYTGIKDRHNADLISRKILKK